MEPTDLTTRILIEIREEQQELRQELRETKQEIRETKHELRAVEQRIDHVSDDLGRRIVESELRTATAIHELGGTLREVHTLLKDRALHDRVSRCEREIDDLKHRLG